LGMPAGGDTFFAFAQKKYPKKCDLGAEPLGTPKGLHAIGWAGRFWGGLGFWKFGSGWFLVFPDQ
ncbi:MAG: hypothetical protein FWC72_07095, partial [Oscillospiraceae bacterium]|nr:hypothetical protein [Oscillospiraceae bacterium]